MSSDFGGGDLPSAKTKDGKFGDHIVINNIAIKMSLSLWQKQFEQ